MRTNLIEGVIIGCGIGVVVLVARWLFHNELLIEVGVVLLGGVLLAVIQIVISRARKRSDAPIPEAEPDHPAPPQAPLISPSLGWSDGAAQVAHTDESEPGEDPANAPHAAESAEHAPVVVADSPDPERPAGNEP